MELSLFLDKQTTVAIAAIWACVQVLRLWVEQKDKWSWLNWGKSKRNANWEPSANNAPDIFA